jgi:hypothetical protein
VVGTTSAHSRHLATWLAPCRRATALFSIDTNALQQRHQAVFRPRPPLGNDHCEDLGAPKSEVERRTRYLLLALLRCGCCGSGYIMISASRLGYAAARNAGTGGCAERARH